MFCEGGRSKGSSMFLFVHSSAHFWKVCGIRSWKWPVGGVMAQRLSKSTHLEPKIGNVRRAVPQNGSPASLLPSVRHTVRKLCVPKKPVTGSMGGDTLLAQGGDSLWRAKRGPVFFLIRAQRVSPLRAAGTAAFFRRNA